MPIRENIAIASVVRPDSIGARTALNMRGKMYKKLQTHFDLESMRSILDVGVTPDTAAYSNYFETAYAHPERITALSDQDASVLEQTFPGLKFVRGDGCALPFADNSFDLVVSSAVLEHVGTFENQRRFIGELLRVARRGVFLTTPNRFHVFEFHTYWPLLHWLPRRIHRRLLAGLGMKYLADEHNLNLLSAGDLRRLADGLPARLQIDFVRFLGMKSNLLLVLTRQA